MRSLNTLSLISASLLHVTRGHITQEIPSTTISIISKVIIFRSNNYNIKVLIYNLIYIKFN
jgi:hypothetical protein